MKVRSQVALLLACCGSPRMSFAQAATPPLGWTSISPPRLGTEAASCANWAVRSAWHVSFSRDSSALVFSPDPGETFSDTVQFEDGRLVSFDHGEFGGDVWWEPRVGPRQHVASVNLVSFVSTPPSVFGLEGLAHLGINRGSLVQFDRSRSGIWQLRQLTQLGAAPFAYTRLSDDTMVVVTSGTLLAVRPPKLVRLLHTDSAWRYTYPHSVVRDRAGVVYVGMRSAVARLVPQGTTFREDWLVPPDCPHLRKVDDLGPCKCVEAP